MTRRVIAGVVAGGLTSSLVTLTAGHFTAHAAVQASRPATVLSVGDRFRVDGAPVGCRVAHLAHYAGRVFVDCRRAGQLAGTYGTLLSGREALIVRFRDAHTAKVVFQAKQEDRSSKCK